MRLTGQYQHTFRVSWSPLNAVLMGVIILTQPLSELTAKAKPTNNVSCIRGGSPYLYFNIGFETKYICTGETNA